MVYRKFSASKRYKEPQVGVTANIVLGSPKKNCAGIGICRIERAQSRSGHAAQKTKCGHAKALLIMKQQQLVIYFVKHTLPICTKQKHFSGEQFRIEERVGIPNEMAVELKLPVNTQIETGDYEMIDLGQHYCIVVNMVLATQKVGSRATLTYSVV